MAKGRTARRRRQAYEMGYLRRTPDPDYTNPAHIRLYALGLATRAKDELAKASAERLAAILARRKPVNGRPAPLAPATRQRPAERGHVGLVGRGYGAATRRARW